jgi:hypothetical protein
LRFYLFPLKGSMIILLLAKLCRVFVNVNIALVFVPSNQ